ncbi:MAG: hemolysin-type calcium-binding repeat family protein [Rhizobium sp.]|nr:hemolysin-type calcium-binding repeat family protein [Rhizobium sp.]
MTKHVVKDDFTSLYQISTFKDQWLFTASSSIVFNDMAPGLWITGAKSTVEFNGRIQTDWSSGILVDATGVKLEIGQNGEVFADDGISSNKSLDLVNRGIISGGVAISGSEASDDVINHGIITGVVRLRGGNDTFQFKSGSLTGAVEGGTGNDTLVTYVGEILLSEGEDEGLDTVKSSDDYILSAWVERLFLTGKKNIEGVGNAEDNLLKGNSGNNILSGQVGNDTFVGAGGNDTINTGDGFDRVFFGTGSDRDRVKDFDQAVDVFNLSSWKAVRNDASLKRHAENHGEDVWIVAGKDILIIEDTSKADLNSILFQY